MRVFLIALFMASLAGCASIKYTNPTTKETLEYKRYFSLVKITGFKLIKDANGIVRLQFDTVESADSKLVDVAASLAQTALSMEKKAP